VKTKSNALCKNGICEKYAIRNWIFLLVITTIRKIMERISWHES
jgi:hypothetical protein